VSFASFAAMPDQFGSLENCQMLGDGRLGDAGVTRQCVDGAFVVAGQLFKDGAARGIGEGAEDVIGLRCAHAETITMRLWFVKQDSSRIMRAW